MRKLVSALLIGLLLVCTAFAQDGAVHTEGLFAYVLTEEGAVITAFLGADPCPEEIGVPAVIGGAPVIGFDFVFSGLPGPVSRVILAEGIPTVGNAFAECSQAAEIVLPASLEDIPEDAFAWSRAEIILHPDNPYFSNEDGFLIDERTGTLLYTAPSAADKPLPAVRRLGDRCLTNWHPGPEVELPDTLVSIGAGVFYEWMDTYRIRIPDGVTEIGAGAFNCAGLTAIDLPAGLKEIPPLMLSCTDITGITLPDSVTSIGSWAFYLCPLTRVEIPAGCTFVAWDAFMPEVELVFLGDEAALEPWGGSDGDD